jgi:hypothetical protein
MPKMKLNDFLKGGDNFEITKIDEHIEEFNKMMKSIEKEKTRIKKLKLKNKNKKY